jgi:hypothetical protein
MPTLGSNYMMDGFDFDSEYGDGPDAARKDPELPRSSRGLAGLPDGFMGRDEPEEEFDFRMVEGGDEHGLGDLSEMFKEATPLMDLAWLESAEQDPARLPESINQIEPTLSDLYQTEFADVPGTGTVNELEQAWGVNRRTDGQNIVPNIVYPRPVTGPTSALPQDLHRTVVAHAMRKSAFGESFENITRDVLAFFGDDISKVQGTPAFKKFSAAIRSVRAEHGLVGNVYVRDSAFPGLHTGKWDAAIKRRCASARYILTSPGSKISALQNYIGKQVVTSIPWGEALDHYRPMIEASGKRIASGDPRKALQAAFTQQAPQTRRGATTFPTHEMPTVSSKEAHEAFSKAPTQERGVISRDDGHAAQAKNASGRIDRWVKAGLVTATRVAQIRAQVLDPSDLLRTVASEISSTKKAAYTGVGLEANKAREFVTTKDAAWTSDQNKEIDRVVLERARAVVANLVTSGKISQQNANTVLKVSSAEGMLRLAAKYVAGPKSADYSGTSFQANVATKKAQDMSPILPIEVRKLLRWASVQMNEGAAGKDLDYLLSARFSNELRKTASEPLTQLRKKHEGLSGHMYVDASAYASTTGTEGCDKGALIHRANQLKMVLGMDRCASCVSNVESHCQKYSKVIVSAIPEKQANRYQTEMIRLANASDSETTASFFTSQGEGGYDLQNEVLDNIEYDSTPPVEELGGILFDGLTLDADEE